MTHEQYLDEPGDSIQWTVRIHDLAERVRADQEREAQET